MSTGAHVAANPRRTWKQRMIIVSGALLSILLLVGASGAGYAYFRFGQITRYAVPIDLAPDAGEPRNYLLVGSDSRDSLDEDDPANDRFFNDSLGGGQRTDTIMILRLNPNDGEADLLSLPRDLFVPIAGTDTRNRINTAFGRGREVLIDTIRDNFGIPIHHYVEVDFVGFEKLVGAIGGVPFYFEERVRDTNSGLFVDEPGCVTLDASSSLAFVRSRHLEIYDADLGRFIEDPSGDLGRISRQQEFIRKAIGRSVSKGLSNPVTLNNLVSVGVDSVGLDPTLRLDDVLALGRIFASFDEDSLRTYSLPVTDFTTSAGAAVLLLVERDAEPILNIFRGLDPSEVSPDLITLTVLNGTGELGYAHDVQSAMSTIGFDDGGIGDTVEQFDGTVIFYKPGDEESAQRVSRHLSTQATLSTDSELDAGNIVLVVGTDFTTVHDQPSPTAAPLPSTTGADADATTTIVPATTTSTTAPIGYLPGEAPVGINCG